MDWELAVYVDASYDWDDDEPVMDMGFEVEKGEAETDELQNGR